MKRVLKWLAMTLGVLLLGCAVLTALLCYVNRSAERRAHAFCDAIALGSTISAAAAKANREKIGWVLEPFYTFSFPGTPFDVAIREVEVDPDGTVLTKAASMVYD